MKRLLSALFGRRGCPGAHDCLRLTRAEAATKTLNLRTARMHDRLTRAERSIAAIEANRLTEQATRAAADAALAARVDRLIVQVVALEKPSLFNSAASYLALFRRG